MTTIREMRRNFVLLLGIRSNVLFSLYRCDRVLYHLNENVRKDTLTVQKYDHVLDMQASDHKPVYCLFNMKVKHHNKKEMKAIHSQIEKDLLDIDTTDIADVLNDLFSVRSQVEISTDSLVFDNISYKVPQEQMITIKNNGEHIAYVSFRKLF